jgi:myo-inositol-1-phosphate synthase
MKKLFKSEQTIPKHTSNRVPKDVIEKTFILNFFRNLPIEGLKKLINFKEFDYQNEDLWNNPDNIEILSILKAKNVVQYTCEIYLEDENQDSILDNLG